MSPSQIDSSVECVDGIAGDSSHDRRDLNGARSMQALPYVMRGGMACRRPKTGPGLSAWIK